MLRFDSMPNFRQLSANPKTTAHDSGPPPTDNGFKLFRSSRPDFLTSKEIEQFRSVGIRSIIDFRSVGEYKLSNGSKLLDAYYPAYKVQVSGRLQYKPVDKVSYVPVKNHADSPLSRFLGNQHKHQNTELGKHYFINFFKFNYIWAVYNRAPWYIRVYSLLLLLVDLVLCTGYRYFVRLYARQVLNREGLYGQYIDMINFSQASIYAALKLLTDPENVPAMLNCAHGKDRTGIVSALVLSCLGRSKEEIARDYALSEDELVPIQARVKDEVINRFHMCPTFVTAKAETMAKVLDYIENKFGSIANYLDGIGFTAKDQEKLRSNLTT